MIYLDANATTPMHPRVWEAMEPYLERHFANPSSLHPAGQEVRAAVERARDQVARLLGVDHGEILFTSGGTESNNLAILGTLALAPRERRRLVTGAGEHPSVMACCEAARERSFELVTVGLEANGQLRTEEALAAIDGATALVTIQGANSEVGTLLSLAAVAARCREVGVPFHVDAVQMPGKVRCDARELGADLLSISAHKLHGPKGAGALVVRRGLRLGSLHHGGGQERGLRPGTENVPGLVGLGAACELALTHLLPGAGAVAALRDRLEEELLAALPAGQVNGQGAPRLPGTTSFTVPGMDGGAAMIALGLEGVAVSTGSACSLGSVRPSAVLMAMGLGQARARSTLRLSLSTMTTSDEIEEALRVIPAVLRRLQRLDPGRGRR